MKRKSAKGYNFADLGLRNSVRSLVNDYNNFRIRVNRFLREKNIREEALLEKISLPSRTHSQIHLDAGITKGYQVKNNCNTAAEIMKKMEEVTLPEEEETELKQIEKDIEELKKSDLNKYARDLEESLSPNSAGF